MCRIRRAWTAGGDGNDGCACATADFMGRSADGPFAETKESLAGFYLLEARRSENDCMAAKIPPDQRWVASRMRPIRRSANNRAPARTRSEYGSAK